ncbi:MAG: zinc ribbon domain-containing protein [Lachnospiraceae bacterium]|nr:zinc ribbon domain-containing protein [Lachnospiraceae bacterium]
MAGLGLGFFIGGLAAIAAIATIIFLAIWTYRDAEDRGMIPILWTALVVLVPSFIGLIVYLVVRTSNNKVKCSNCNTYVSSNMKYCSNCGVELTPADIDIDKKESFKKSQTKVLIGIFVSMGLTIVCGIMMIVSFIIGALSFAGEVVEVGKNIDIEEIADNVSDAIEDVDEALSNSKVNVRIADDDVIITDEHGNELVRVNKNDESININGNKIKNYIEENGEEGEEVTDEDIDKIEDAIIKAIDDSSEIQEKTEQTSEQK